MLKKIIFVSSIMLLILMSLLGGIITVPYGQGRGAWLNLVHIYAFCLALAIGGYLLKKKGISFGIILLILLVLIPLALIGTCSLSLIGVNMRSLFIK